MAELADALPRNIYDVRVLDGIRFGVRLHKPSDYGAIYGGGRRFLDLKPRKGDVVVDAGAHIGSNSLRYSKLVSDVGRVIAFEPEPDNRRILQWNLNLNKALNVEVHREALGDFTGIAKLNLSVFSVSHSLVRLTRNVGQVLVPVIKLDDVGLDRLDLLKINVEGFEIYVLRGGERTLSSLNPKMQIEVHAPHSRSCQVCNWLDERGFSTKILQEGPEEHWIRAC